jgi:5-methylcytosine-specific restriction endonuclease McrA
MALTRYNKRVNDPRDSRAWRALRKTILARDQYICAYCGQDADTVDHVHSIKNNPDMAMNPENLVSACRRCNSMKGSRSEGVFLARKFTPPVFPANLSPKTTSSVQAGPMSGQPKPEL